MLTAVWVGVGYASSYFVRQQVCFSTKRCSDNVAITALNVNVATHRKEVGDMVAEGTIVGVLLEGHDLDGIVS